MKVRNRIEVATGDRLSWSPLGGGSFSVLSLTRATLQLRDFLFSF